MNGLNEAQNKIKMGLLNYFSSSNSGLSYAEMDNLSSSFITKYFSGPECDGRIDLINKASSKSVIGGLSSKPIDDYQKVDELVQSLNGQVRQ